MCKDSTEDCTLDLKVVYYYTVCAHMCESVCVWHMHHHTCMEVRRQCCKSVLFFHCDMDSGDVTQVINPRSPHSSLYIYSLSGENL